MLHGTTCADGCGIQFHSVKPFKERPICERCQRLRRIEQAIAVLAHRIIDDPMSEPKWAAFLERVAK